MAEPNDYSGQLERALRYSRSDHQAFHRAIVAAPHDDTPPLVYADYLDEQGHHALATLIRRSIHEGHAPKYVADRGYPVRQILPSGEALPPYGYEEQMGQVFSEGSPTYPYLGLSALIPTRTVRGEAVAPHNHLLLQLNVRGEEMPHPRLGISVIPGRAFELPVTPTEAVTLADHVPNQETAKRLREYATNRHRFVQPGS